MGTIYEQPHGMIFMDSVDLNRCIDEDFAAYPFDPFWGFNTDAERLESIYDIEPLEEPELPSWAKWSPTKDPNSDQQEDYNILVNPRTGSRMSFAEFQSAINLASQEPPAQLPSKTTKPYHPHHDHDYLKMPPDEESDVEVKVEKVDEDEPDVDVWRIDHFNEKKVSALNIVSEESPAYQAMKEIRRSSKRTADTRRSQQARKISKAVHAVFKTKKTVNVRQFKNIKPKNSVETTPSQSDIEEWHSQPVRPTCTKITKKKTSKGRTDHSESERHRREVLRKNFQFLSELIPVDFLRGEKATSQISKQKILNGAKSLIIEVHKAKSSYKLLYQQNGFLRQRLQGRETFKLFKSLKRQK